MRKKNAVKSFEIVGCWKGDTSFLVRIVLNRVSRILYDDLISYIERKVRKMRNIDKDKHIYITPNVVTPHKLLVCPECNRIFYITNSAFSAYNYYKDSNVSINGPYCSEECYYEARKKMHLRSIESIQLPDKILHGVQNGLIKSQTLKCSTCGKSFTLSGIRLSQYKKMSKSASYNGPFCCEKCKNDKLLEMRLQPKSKWRNSLKRSN